MKKLQTSDIFAAMRVVKAADVKEQLKPILRKVSEGKTSVEDIGIEAVLTILECAANVKAESAVYNFLSSPFEMSADEVAALPLDAFMANLEKLAKENDLGGFFKRLSDLMSTN